MKKLILSLFVIASLVSCKDKKAEEAAMAAAAQKRADSVAMVERAKFIEDSTAKAVAAAAEAADTTMWLSAIGKKLKSQIVASPANQNDIDKNIILKYAAKNNLDIKFTKTGLAYILEKPGTGAFAKTTDQFSANYKGYFLDGNEFDSSYKRNAPLEMPVSQVVPAWVEAFTTLVKPGGKIKILVPSALGYGPKGHPAGIPGNTVLAFDMELLKIMK